MTPWLFFTWKFIFITFSSFSVFFSCLWNGIEFLQSLLNIINKMKYRTHIDMVLTIFQKSQIFVTFPLSNQLSYLSQLTFYQKSCKIIFIRSSSFALRWLQCFNELKSKKLLNIVMVPIIAYYTINFSSE